MKIGDRAPFLLPLVGAAIIVGTMIAALIINPSVWQTQGWEITGMFYVYNNIILGLGIILPGIVLILCIVGLLISKESKNIQITFGIIIVSSGALLLTVGIIFLGISVPDYFSGAKIVDTLSVIFDVLLLIATVMAISLGFSGMKIMKYTGE